jgi:hypothetical protein
MFTHAWFCLFLLLELGFMTTQPFITTSWLHHNT